MVRTCWWGRPEVSSVAGGGIGTVSAMVFQGGRSRVGAAAGPGCVFLGPPASESVPEATMDVVVSRASRATESTCNSPRGARGSTVLA